MDPLLEIKNIYCDVSNPAGYSSLNKLFEAMKTKMTKEDTKKIQNGLRLNDMFQSFIIV